MSKISKSKETRPALQVSRRRFVQTAGALAAGGLAGTMPFARPGAAQAKAIKIGYVSPQTGPLAAFAESDNFIIGGIKQAIGSGLKTAAGSVPVEIIVKDSQSNPNRAAQVAADLILKDGVDLMLVASTPETTNPVSDQCEINEVPCISSVAPWQPWFFTRGGDPKKGFNWTYHFFWGLEDIIGVFTDMWATVPTNKKVGAIWPNDGDGNAWGDPKVGFPGPLKAAGYTIIDPGRYQNLTDDFSAQINAFKSGGAEIVTGVPIPPDFTTFWTQAAQQGFAPKIASVGKALLFPVAVEALKGLGEGLSTEVWWTPHHPFKSSLTGASAADLAAGYTKATGKQWTQPIGFAHALFEVALDSLKRSKDVHGKAAIRDALVATKLDTIVGPIDWSHGPVKNVAKTPLVGGQWRKGDKFMYDLTIVTNKQAPAIPTGGALVPIKRA